MNDLLLAAILHVQDVGNQGRLTLSAPTGIVRPFIAVSATRWDRETEVLFRAGIVAGDRARLSLGVLATDLEGDDADGRTCIATEVTIDL